MMASTMFLLLVEGKDDEKVILRFLDQHACNRELIRIQAKEGYNRLVESIPVHTKQSNLERLGIVVDADIDLDRRWQSLTQALVIAGYGQIPRRPEPGGTIIEQPDLPVLGVWLMPDNTTRGMLEDFVSLMVPDGDKLWEYSSDCLREVVRIDRRFPESRLAKARIHTWLAWQEEPGTALSAAITKNYLRVNSPNALVFLGWLSRLFPGLTPPAGSR